MNRRVAHLQWLARFDMESLISAILRTGLLLSLGLILMGLGLSQIGGLSGVGNERLVGTNILQFLLGGLARLREPARWSQALVHLGIAALLLTPYVRVVASVFYFAWVERHPGSMLLAGIVGVTLTGLIVWG